MRTLFSKSLVCTLFAFFVSQSVYGLEIPAGSREFGLELEYQYNLGFAHCWNLSVFGSVEFNRFFLLKSGISAGYTGKVGNVNCFLLNRFSVPFYTPLNIKLAYLYNGLPEYETNIHTMLPLFGLEWKYFGFSLGTSLRFTGFWEGDYLFEVIPAYSACLTFLSLKKVQAHIEWANFSDYEAGNLGSYEYRLKSMVRLTNHLSITNCFEIAMSGSISRLVSVYAYSYRGGVVFSW
jgi:hypothetical protein